MLTLNTSVQHYIEGVRQQNKEEQEKEIKGMENGM